ncbi:HNH endonuclease, partial [Salmonella enterica]|nr:HNH endonuclease [Salmonella enterica]
LQVLEAAHIHPYLGEKTNVVSNGLLLRADVHTLFDLGLLWVNPADLRIGIAEALRHSE